MHSLQPQSSTSFVIKSHLSQTFEQQLNAHFTDQTLETITDVLSSQESKFTDIEQTFTLFMCQDSALNARRVFIHNWRQLQLSGNLISIVANKLSYALSSSNESTIRKHLLLQAVIDLTRLANNELGVYTGVPEQELFNDMATPLCNGDEWKLNQFKLPKTREIAKQRYKDIAHSAQFDKALFLIVLEQIYAYSEFKIVKPMLLKAISSSFKLSYSAQLICMNWVEHYSQRIASNHVSLSVSALYAYLQSMKLDIDQTRIKSTVEQFINAKHAAYDEISLHIFNESMNYNSAYNDSSFNQGVA